MESSSLTDSTSSMSNNVVKSIISVFVLLSRMSLCSMIMSLSADNSILWHCVTFVVTSHVSSSKQYLEASAIWWNSYVQYHIYKNCVCNNMNSAKLFLYWQTIQAKIVYTYELYLKCSRDPSDKRLSTKMISQNSSMRISLYWYNLLLYSTCAEGPGPTAWYKTKIVHLDKVCLKSW